MWVKLFFLQELFRFGDQGFSPGYARNQLHRASPRIWAVAECNLVPGLDILFLKINLGCCEGANVS
jgi:hypothetical protein